ncbi:hypothetical protein B0T22DRAFT_494703 [Podospora appendiculata]|uniref:Oxidase ustYa n=1 Tax=Podospora appendiculata TaxID=314037 RepID=A0AAE0X072_9PEZI|nr:hypothetical protein B0T22DRAFT_494703 [Podospora appendiculata]
MFPNSDPNRDLKGDDASQNLGLLAEYTDVEHRGFPLPNTASQPSRRREGVIRGTIALVSIAAGIALGCWYSSLASTSLETFGINPRTPIPLRVFTDRQDVAFIPHREFMGPSDEANDNWASITRGSDAIFLADPSSYGQREAGIRAPFFTFTPPPPAAQSLANLHNFYVLNSLHQLHCVNMARRRYNQLVYGHATPLSDTPIDADWLTHIEHCFEYLRLSVMCADYMTFESDSPAGSPEEYVRDNLGWGVVHSCINWEALMGFQRDQVRLYNSTWEGV